MNDARGVLVTLEGIEGVGKSTQAQFVADYFRRYGHPVVLTREPGGTPVGEAIRRILLDTDQGGMADLTELLLLFAARADHLQRVIRPALLANQIVVCDRFTDASYAYQGAGRGIDKADIDAIKKVVVGGLEPHLTLLLDAPAEVGLARADRRGEKDRFEQEEVAFFDAVRRCYLELAEQQPRRFQVIDAARPIDQVQEQISTALETLTAQL